MDNRQHMNDQLNEILNYQIATETILDKYPNTDKDTIDYIWSKCNGNPCRY